MRFLRKVGSDVASFYRQQTHGNVGSLSMFVRHIFRRSNCCYGSKKYSYWITGHHSRHMCSEGLSGNPLKTVASIQNRTRSLLKALCDAQNEQSKLIRLEIFNQHILTYLNAGRSEAIRAGALEIMLNIKNSKNNEVKKEARKALSLLGWVEPVKSWGVRVLCIDGGGSRGIVPIETLKRIEDLCNKEIHELFDLICGVSTGAILAVLLAIQKMPLDECEYVYKNMSMNLFEQNSLIGTGKLFWTHAFYDTERLENILKSYSGELKLIETACYESTPKVVLVSTIVNQPVLRPHVFCNYTHPFGSSPRFSSGCQHKIWEALKASSAAPGFFEECKLGTDIHQDGGLLTNNPCSIAIHESRLLWPTTPFQCVLSLGTGLYKGRLGSSTPRFSSLREKLLKVVASATDTEAVDTVLRDLLPKSTYYRCNPSLSEDVPMDECRPEMIEQVQIDTKTYLEKNRLLLEKAAQALMKPKTLTQRLQDKWSKYNRWSS